MPDAKSTVLVIDDDPDLRASIGRLLRSLDLDARLFASVSDFLKSDLPDGPACLVLDVRLPGQSGLDFQRELAGANRQVPIIFITGHGDIPMSVQAMKGGAIEFLTKPFRDQELLDAIQLGLSRDRARRENEKALVALKERFASLSPREREIMIQVAQGRLSKQIAGEIGIAEATVKVHRSRAMRKMNARSLPELGRMADKLHLLPEKPQNSRAGISGLRVGYTIDRRVRPASQMSGRRDVILLGALWFRSMISIKPPEFARRWTAALGKRCSANPDLNISFATASKPRFSATQP